ncbi:uncharacterized protein CANTADRAFT_70541 [Suhomyces tanzawaensis NRRL Y-17324]|uniref:Vacuolar membrane-associated protein IML1 n=1 Tax=Suhomyces tanzawaensis NRRL Y-17324 TaxID=984487 RepID=A0A1E4SD15_9ASCO|nr:uncharacterized protein CANTADRAFT_70541 [Suhomyces tanzawaensis NRRL Y-17324]ODV77395.1 hypothetical protein CANTADRAFT_70541 [Suhomyces tanzawaensis NRRL Y-17324]
MQHARYYNPNKKLNKTVSNSSQSELHRTTSSSSITAHQASIVIGSKSASISPSGSKNLMSRNVGSTITIGRKVSTQVKTNRFQQIGPSTNSTTGGEESITELAPNNQQNSLKDPIPVTVWFHELRSSNEDVIIDAGSTSGIQHGKVYEFQLLESAENKLRKLFFVAHDRNFKESANNEEDQLEQSLHSNKSKAQITLISTPLRKLLDIPPRSAAQIKLVEDPSTIEVESVEIFIKDINLSRDIMWTLSSALVGTCAYIEKRVSYFSNRIGLIKAIYNNGKEVFSGYIGKDTKIIFRSESAKLTVLIQLSREMWHFEENGEIIFHKLVNNLLPKIFKKWRANNTHHSITIVLFTSVDLTDIPWITLNQGERPNNRRDYYRVVVDQVNILSWDRIMANLRLEFANFKRDIMLKQGIVNQYYMEGEPLPAVKGNTLEALNLGLSLVHNKFRNTDLKHSLNHFILITPGTGLFDVNYDLLLETSKKMATTDCSLDVVSLSQPPLHTVPLFRYGDKSGATKHCVPNWCDISFYKDISSSSNHQWIPRCKIYELQMMGVMENEVNDVRIERFKMKRNERSLLESMDKYDDDVFKPIKEKVDYFNDAEIDNYRLESTHKSKFKPTNLKDSNATLSLIFSNRTMLTNGAGTTATVSVTGSEVSATGTVTTTNNTETSALSSLYVLNKNTDEKKVPSNASLRSKSSFIREQPKRVESSLKPRNNLTIEPLRANKKHNEQLDKFRSRTKSNAPKDNFRSRLKSNEKLSRSHKRSSGGTGLIENEPESETDKYWKDVPNPSKETHSDILLQTSRWSDVFPANVKRKLIKWNSIQSPAALPITTSIFPTTKQLESDYTFQIYNVLLNPDENYLELKTTHELMREMIQLRLLTGFQICYGPNVEKVESERRLGVGGTNNGGQGCENVFKYFPDSEIYGITLYMSFHKQIHRISLDYSGNLNVQLYKKSVFANSDKSKLALGLGHGGLNGNSTKASLKPYFPLIRTRYADEYSTAKLDAINLKSSKLNWNQFDQYLAGYEDIMPDVNKEFYQMKFVIMPTDIPKNAYYINNESLSDEEIRVEGLRKLIGLIEKAKYDKKDKVKVGKVPEIIFYTGNLYDFLNEEAENYDITGAQPKLMIPENMRFNKTIKINELAQELQGETGLRLVDRTWHFKKHFHCFIGSELITWLQECFEDIESREEATSYGQTLMNKGLFRHVDARHGLLDGYYFYEIEDEYVDELYKQETPSWFTKKKPEKEITNGTNSVQGSSTTPVTPTTPILNPSNTRNNSDADSILSPHMRPQNDPLDLTRIISGNLNESDGGSSLSGSTHGRQKRKKFVLSKSVKINVDPLSKSFRPEIVTVHYDRVHNPEHCYHIRLQWLNTNSRFIDDSVLNWSRLCERHGLKLVETPWKELCTIPSINPFHSFVDLKLVVNPWLDDEFNDASILRETKFYYHLYLLKKTGFLLDNRSTVFFLKGHIEISYSWGKPTFQYAQYIHRTGSYFVELRDSGDFFLAPNNIHITRVNTLLTSLPDNDNNSRTYHLDSQRVMLNFRSTCQNPELLREIFREAKNHWEDKNKTHVMPSTV